MNLSVLEYIEINLQEMFKNITLVPHSYQDIELIIAGRFTCKNIIQQKIQISLLLHLTFQLDKYYDNIKLL